jgi:hypothetical protein
MPRSSSSFPTRASRKAGISTPSSARPRSRRTWRENEILTSASARWSIHFHGSGTGGASKYGNFRVTPAIGEDAWDNLAFPRSAEQASPGYYAVTIGRPGKQIRVELTAARLAGFHRYIFPATSDARIVIDASATIPLGGGGPRSDGGTVRVIDARHISGSMTFEGGWGKQAKYTLHFWAEFDRPAVDVGRWQSARGSFTRIAGTGSSEGGDTRKGLDNRLGTYATFDTRQNVTIQMKLGVSFVSVDQARRNMEEERPGWSFDQARSAAQAKWAEALGKIEVEGGTDAQRQIFYSALYRAELMPHDLTGENVWWRSAEPHYEDFYTLWDTFRTQNPLLTLIEPKRERDIVRSLLDTVTPRLQRVLDAFEISPAIIKNLTWDVIAWNRAAAVLFTDYAKVPREQRNILRLMFGSQRTRNVQHEWESVARAVVAGFRIDVARAGATEQVSQLIDELSAISPEFSAYWQDNEVIAHTEGVKRLNHPKGGLLELEFSSFAVEGRPELSMIVYNPVAAADADRVRALVEEKQD